MDTFKSELQKNKHIIHILAMASLFALFMFIHFASASEITADNVIRLVNESREKEGLPGLRVSEILSDIAKDKADDMVSNHYFAHTSPQGITPWYWFGKNQYDYRYAGENLAINFTNSEDEQEAWMNSPTHRKNILNPNYKEIGVAIAVDKVDGKESLIVVQEFGALIGSSETGAKKEENAASDPASKEAGAMPAILSIDNINGPTDSEGKNDGLLSGNQSGEIGSQGMMIELLDIAIICLIFALFISIPAVFVEKSWKDILAVMNEQRRYRLNRNIEQFK
ncbi:MAG: hypothetical protein HGB08_00890 [Candidatus Moranbacteria bacterium]|nr:hypothetical protein [Candidatus Moranbacteria bacterium]